MWVSAADRLTIAEQGEGEQVEMLTENGLRVLQARYLKKDETGKCTETPAAMFRRVASTLADVELLYGGDESTA